MTTREMLIALILQHLWHSLKGFSTVREIANSIAKEPAMILDTLDVLTKHDFIEELSLRKEPMMRLYRLKEREEPDD